MDTKKKVILGGGILLLLIGGGLFGWKKGWFGKKSEGEKDDNDMSMLDRLKSTVSKDKDEEKKDDKNKDDENKGGENTTVSNPTATNASKNTTSSNPTTVTNASKQTSSSYHATGYSDGALDLYHKMISSCAEIRQCKKTTSSEKVMDVLLKTGVVGNSYASLCYDNLSKIYGESPFFDEAMALIGSKGQFRKDLKQYIDEGTFRI